MMLWIFAAPSCATPIYHNITVCHGFGCNFKSTISLSTEEWHSAANWFDQEIADAKTERERIRHAIGWMEVLVGRHGPGREDRALDLQHVDYRMGQMDCVDESINTTTYLKLFENSGLLRWHRVVERIQRRAMINAHWASQIEEVISGERYVVDSWFQDNGMLPNIQSQKDWSDIPFYSALQDNASR
ncbi:MAG: hypothetical protein CL398_02375 [Acidiferrobacteraceae bacterium]|mgnify:CR=1 FL=1|nr:hypothetical protein [Acidiferrobacteraceae bacterium]